MTYEVLGLHGEPPLELSDSVKAASVKPTNPELAAQPEAPAAPASEPKGEPETETGLS